MARGRQEQQCEALEPRPPSVPAALEISDRATYELAVAARQELKDYLDAVDAYFEPLRETAHAAYQAVLGKRREARAAAEPLLRRVNAELGAWEERQERERQAERRQMEAGGAADRRRRANAAAQELIDSGYSPEDVAALGGQLAETAPPSGAPAEPEHITDPTLSVRRVWRGRVTDPRRLVKFVASKAGEHFMHLLEVRQPAVDQLARDQRDKLSVPGLEAYSETRVADRGGRR